jgi:hypothetical protein
MQRVRDDARVRLAVVWGFATGIVLASASTAFSQAWVAPAGVGAVTVAMQNLEFTGHNVTDGTYFPIGGSVHNRVDIEADYAITDRLSITAGIPLVFAKYLDANPLPSFVPFLPVDACRCWQSGWQDVAFTARYNLRNDAFALTPSVSVGVPSHAYNFRGEAALGNRLKELRIAVNAGQRLDVISPRLSVQGQYSYAFVEQVLDIPNNRSNAALETAVLMGRRVGARVLMAWQRVHGGLRLGSPSGIPFVPPGEADTPERMFEHDRLLRDNHFRVGGGVSYSFERVDLFVSYLSLVQGTDSHGGRALTVGISMPFQIAVDGSGP